ncbi:MAG: hypothetical protein QF593_09880 [Nitrospinota bacterium]|nr:hypothetical protein [Nitrospinota bacterium]
MAGKPFRFVNEYTVFTLPWEVGILEGLFEKEGIEVEIAAKNPSNVAPELFGRNKEVLFEGEDLDAYNVCDWGARKTAPRPARGKGQGRRPDGALPQLRPTRSTGMRCGRVECGNGGFWTKAPSPKWS